MEKEIYLPEKIKNLISGKDYIANEVGKSEAKVMLFDALGIEPNMEKIRYYILLDELY
jgi:hypothetical protein